jgi:hypothetical protein
LAFDGVSARSIILIAAVSAFGCLARHETATFETPIGESECKQPSSEVAAPYTARDLGVEECRAPRDWRLLLVASDANSWIDITGPGVTWSGERPIVYESPVGNFPNVDSSPPVEWRLDASNRPAAVIFRVTAQDPKNPDAHLSRFYVVRLTDRAGCVVGRVATVEEARTLAESSPSCPDSRPR